MKRFICFVLSIILILSTSITAFATNKTIVKENENIAVSKIVITDEDKKQLESLPVEIKAKAAVLMEVSSGKVLMEYNPDTKLFPASVTKIMTILLIMDALDSGKISLTDTVTCSENASSMGGSQIWFQARRDFNY